MQLLGKETLCLAGTYCNVCHMQKATLTLRAKKRGSFEPRVMMLCLQANKIISLDCYYLLYQLSLKELEQII